MIPYGNHKDEHMGEQFYTESIRILVHQALVDRGGSAEALYWIAGNAPLEGQCQKIADLCRKGIDNLKTFYLRCRKVSDGLAGDEKILFDATLLLQVKIHYFCAKGVTVFGDGYEAFSRGDYPRAFVAFGKCCEMFDQTSQEMRGSEYGNWEDFYLNDCLADVKHTGYMIRKMMGVVREFGDNASHDGWYRKYCLPVEDQKVFLLLVTDNHMTDWELYQAMKDRVEA
jgi:hypothetical protein